MTWENFKLSFAILQQEYKHELKDLNAAELSARMKFWYGEFGNVPDAVFANAIRQIIRTNKFFPKISEIYEILQDEQLPKLDPEIEFQKAITIIKNNPIRPLDYICPTTGDLKCHITTLDDVLGKLPLNVAKAVRSVGITRMMDINDRVWAKKEFAELLNDARSEQKRVILKNGLAMNDNGGIEHERSNNRRIE